MKYRKKPVIIEAVEFSDDQPTDVLFFLGNANYHIDQENGGLYIHTLEGDMRANIGDYVIKGVNGEFYPCKPDIFLKTYEPVNDGQV